MPFFIFCFNVIENSYENRAVTNIPNINCEWGRNIVREDHTIHMVLSKHQPSSFHLKHHFGQINQIQRLLRFNWLGY